MSRTVTPEKIEDFKEGLRNRRVNEATIRKYTASIKDLEEYLQGREITQSRLEEYKTWLIDEKQRKKSSINSYIIAIRSFCRIMNWDGLELHTYTLDVSPGTKYISRSDYQRLVTTAMYFKEYRLAMMIQTLCHMNIRYSEMDRLTVEAVRDGFVEVTRRQRVIRLEVPEYLRESLEAYARRGKLDEGILFRTSSGKTPDRTNAWREIKQLCVQAGLDARKITLNKLKKPLVQDYYPFYPMED